MQTNQTIQHGKVLIEYKTNIWRIAIGKTSFAESKVQESPKLLKPKPITK